MKRAFCIVVTIILISSPLFACSPVKGDENNLKSIGSEQFQNGYRYNVQGWIYLHIEGKPYDRGYQHGYLLAAEIIDMINRWSNVIHNYPKYKFVIGGVSSPRYEKVSHMWWDFCKTRIVKMYWREYPEEYQQEIKGIADGVNAKGFKLFGKAITFQDILTLNEMYEFMTKFENPKEGIHPLRTFFHSLKQIIPGLSDKDENEFISAFLSQPKTHHCSGFIATGDATSHGQIVATHVLQYGGWWYSYYIAQRWNVILDIEPTEGNRVLMSTSPGYIWSDENYYQNSKGIILSETTCLQGLWKETGLPFAIRTRKAAQYSNSIDDAINYGTYKNDGIWTTAWLFGDTKTGEIARLDLGLYKSKIWRTKNGYYYAANNLKDIGVRFETNGLGLKGSFLKFINNPSYVYETLMFYPTQREKKFDELAKQFYGKIDVDVVKKMVSTPPIANYAAADCKITDTTLVENNGLWAFFGYQNGEECNVSSLQKTLKGVKDVPASGWALVYGLPSEHNHQLIRRSNYDYGNKEEIFWDFTTNVENNIAYSHSTVSDDVVYSATSSGMIYALDTYNGDLLWEKNLSGKTVITPTVYDNIVLTGSDNVLYALGKNDGQVKWSKTTLGTISSSPVATDDIVIVGTDKAIQAFACVNGNDKWGNLTQAPAYLSVPSDNTVFMGSDKRCYAVDIENGKTKWVFEMDGPVTSPPAVYDGTVYVGSWDTYLYAINAEDGKLKWKYETGWGIDNTPTVRDGTVFFGSMDNNFYALSAENGKNLWTFTCQASIHSSPVTYGEYVFFGSDDGRFYALNRTTGNPVWFFAPGYSLQGDVYNYITTPVLSNPVVCDKTVFLGVKGHIFALNVQTSEHPKVIVSEKFEITLSAWILIIIVLFAIVVITSFYFSRKTKK